MESTPTTLTLSGLAQFIDKRFPEASASSWDVVGLTVGKPDADVTSVLWAVDPTYEVVMQAVELGADALVTHHPLMLKGVTTLDLSRGTGRVVEALLAHRIGLICAHTNADLASPGVNDALATACGIIDAVSLDAGGEPGLGRWGYLPHPLSLGDFASSLASQLPSSPAGIRVSGDLSAPVSSVAVVGGAGDRFFADAERVSADVFVTADLRHHPVSEQRAAVRQGAPYVIDAGHWATEWLWLDGASQALRAEAAKRGWRVRSQVSQLCTDPWTACVETTGPCRGSQHNNVGEAS